MLAAFACGAPASSNSLFSSGSASAIGGSTDAAGGSVSSAGADNVSAGGNSLAGAGSGGLPTAGGFAGDNAGSGGLQQGGAANGGAGNGGAEVGGTMSGGGDGARSGAAGGNGGSAGGGVLQDCSAFGAAAMFYSQNAHCYLAVHDAATFADARTHCAMLGAHLVTLSDQAENDFVWSLDSAEHWIGATDGKGPTEMLVGTYSWVDGEPFTYTDWSPGQPNASPSTCSINGGDPCYEHCAFQWSSGVMPGQWNDRLCTHTIEAVCEWDSAK